tara:strand:+ start:233 stop:1147 length:915 start_codon:yes stop_codon:yes gene_type:complete
MKLIMENWRRFLQVESLSAETLARSRRWRKAPWYKKIWLSLVDSDPNIPSSGLELFGGPLVVARHANRAARLSKSSKAGRVTGKANFARATLSSLKSINKQMDTLAIELRRHIRSNIPMSSRSAALITKHMPKYKARGKVFRGMHVSAKKLKELFPSLPIDFLLQKGPGVHVIKPPSKFVPRGGTKKTSSWSTEFNEASYYAQHGTKGQGAGQIEVLYVTRAGGSNPGIQITKIAEDTKHVDAVSDYAEVAMIGEVHLDKIIIINKTGLPKGQHVPRFEEITKAPAGFYKAGSREEVLKTRDSL